MKASSTSSRDPSCDEVEVKECLGRRYTFTLGQVHHCTHFIGIDIRTDTRRTREEMLILFIIMNP